MKPASCANEACFVGHRSLYHFFHIFSIKKYSPRTYEMSIKNIVILRILCCLLFLLP